MFCQQLTTSFTSNILYLSLVDYVIQQQIAQFYLVTKFPPKTDRHLIEALQQQIKFQTLQFDSDQSTVGVICILEMGKKKGYDICEAESNNQLKTGLDVSRETISFTQQDYDGIAI